MVFLSKIVRIEIKEWDFLFVFSGYIFGRALYAVVSVVFNMVEYVGDILIGGLLDGEEEGATVDMVVGGWVGFWLLA